MTLVTALYDALHALGPLGPTGDPRVCAALLRAVSTVGGLALREVAAVDAYGSHVEVGQPSAAALVQAAVDCTQAVASGTVRLARRLASDLRPVGDLLIAGRLTRRHCAAVVHGVRGLDANIVTNSLDAICNLAVVTDPDTLARELRLRAEASIAVVTRPWHVLRGQHAERLRSCSPCRRGRVTPDAAASDLGMV